MIELSPLKALVVDDCEHIRALLTAMLQRGCGVHVNAVATAAEALSQFQADPAAFNFLLVDFEIGEESGVDLLTKLMAIDASCCALMITGQPGTAEVHMQDAGLNVQILSKPISLAQLKEALQTFCGVT